MWGMREREYSKVTLEVFSLRNRNTGVTSLTSKMGEGWGWSRVARERKSSEI